jgi:hypothetical protein
VRRWLELGCLSWAEHWLLIQAAVLLPVTDLAIKWLGLRRWQSTLASWAPHICRSPEELPILVRRQPTLTARLVGAAARHGVSGANCLQQSVCLWWLLRRQQIDADLLIGTRKVAGEFEAHAWVELAGVVLTRPANFRTALFLLTSRLSPLL